MVLMVLGAVMVMMMMAIAAAAAAAAAAARAALTLVVASPTVGRRVLSTSSGVRLVRHTVSGGDGVARIRVRARVRVRASRGGDGVPASRLNRVGGHGAKGVLLHGDGRSRGTWLGLGVGLGL
eukprot:scaffold80316_cov36-Phaeocystis_antarctica.AAC.1